MREQNKEQFERIYAENYSRLYFFALNIIGDREASKDILNDVFAAVWKGFERIDKTTINTYLTSSVRNRAVDYLRHNIQRAKYDEEYVHNASIYYSEYSEDKERIVAKMMAQLRPPTDKILELCYLQQKKYSEVAELLGISKSSVKKHIMKALRTLRELYGSKDAQNRLMDV